MALQHFFQGMSADVKPLSHHLVPT